MHISVERRLIDAETAEKTFADWLNSTGTASRGMSMVKIFKAGVPYEEALYRDLQNDAFTAEYLSAALEEGDLQVFLLALRDVLTARGGFAD